MILNFCVINILLLSKLLCNDEIMILESRLLSNNCNADMSLDYCTMLIPEALICLRGFRIKPGNSDGN